MSELTMTARCKIHEGKLNDFKRLSGECIAIVKEKDPGTLRYDWYIDETKMECHILEKYTSSEALMAHMGNLGETLGAVIANSDIQLEIYGDPSQEVRDAVGALTSGVFSYHSGL